MQLTILGCWAPYPRPGEACSGYLLRGGETALMLEAGNGSFAELTRHFDYRLLSGIVLTHYHPDHYADIFCLRHAIEGARRERKMSHKVKLFVPPEPEDVYTKLAEYTEAFSIINVEKLPLTEEIPGIQTRKALLNDMEVYFVPTAHALLGYAVLIRQKGKIFFFSGDTAATREIEKAAHKADLFLCEASGLDKDLDYLAGAHMSARQAGDLGKRAGVSQLLITHFWPEYNVNDLLQQASVGFGSKVTAVQQSKTFMV